MCACRRQVAAIRFNPASRHQCQLIRRPIWHYGRRDCRWNCLKILCTGKLFTVGSTHVSLGLKSVTASQSTAAAALSREAACCWLAHLNTRHYHYGVPTYRALGSRGARPRILHGSRRNQRRWAPGGAPVLPCGCSQQQWRGQQPEHAVELTHSVDQCMEPRLWLRKVRCEAHSKCCAGRIVLQRG